MTSSIELTSKVYEYVNHKITLRELESWLVPRLQIFTTSPDSRVEILASAIELGLAEFHAGLRSTRGIRSLLSRELGNPIVWMPFGDQEAQDMTGSTAFSQPMVGAWASPSPIWNIESQVVPA